MALAVAGLVVATVCPAAANDAFANRIVLTGHAPTATANLTGFTAEPDEPSDLVGDGSGTPSAWWSWTAPCSFTITEPAGWIDTNRSVPDTVLAVFTGSSLGALVRVSSDDDSGLDFAARVPSAVPGPGSINVMQGTTYQIRVRSKKTDTGPVSLDINTPCPPPPTTTGVDPESGPPTGGTRVTITGTGFQPGATVITRSNTPVPLIDVVVVNATTILATTPARTPRGEGLIVTNSDGQTTGFNSSRVGFIWRGEFVDEPVASDTRIRAIHVTEMRARIDAVRNHIGMASFAWRDTVTALTAVRAIHIADLRTALTEAFVFTAREAPAFRDPVLSSGVTPIRRIHIEDLRAFIHSLEFNIR